MKRIIAALLLFACGFAHGAATVPNIFNTMPAGNVAASTLDVNFALVSNLNTFSNYLVDTGGANAYAVAFPAGQTGTLAAGLTVRFLASADNTGASTLNVGGTGVKSIINFDGTALSAGQIKAGGMVAVSYDGTAYQLGSGGSLASSAVTATKLTTGRTIGITGDMTWTSPAFDGTADVTAAGTLATVNTNVGAFGSSTAIPTITANGKGLITGITTNAVVAPAATLTGNFVVGNFNSGTGASNTTYWRGDMTWATPGGAGAPGGATTNVQINDAGAFYGDAGFVYTKATGSVALGVANTSPTFFTLMNSAGTAGAYADIEVKADGAALLQLKVAPITDGGLTSIYSSTVGGMNIYTNASTALGIGTNGTATAIVINAAQTLTTIGTTLALGAHDLTMTGSLGATGARVTKGWFTELEVTNAIVGSVNGNAHTADITTNIAGGAGGQIPYQLSANTTQLLANGTAGQVLTSQGTTLAPAWSSVGSGTVTHSAGNLSTGNFVLGNGGVSGQDLKDAGWAIVPVVNGGTGVTTSTGTGNVVLSASPTLTGTLAAASGTFSGTLGVTGLLSSLGGNIGIDNGGASASGQQFFGAAGNVAGTNTTGGVLTVFGHSPNAVTDLSTPPYNGSAFVGAAGIIARGFSEASQYRGSLEFWVETNGTPAQGMLIGHDRAVSIPGTFGVTGDQTNTNAVDALHVLTVANTNGSGTSATAALEANADTASAVIQSHGTGRVATRWGITLGGWSEVKLGAGSGMAVGTTNATSLILGTNSLARVTIDSAGVATFTSTPVFSSLTASLPVIADASKNLVSATQTGTGTTFVMSAGPTITGTLAAASGTYSGTLGVTGVATFGNGAILGTPASGNFSTGAFTWPTFNQNTSGTAAKATALAADPADCAANQFAYAINASGTLTCSAIGLTTGVSGVLPSANGGTGVSNAGTITNASNTTITGGGTLALGGFTLTTPATGTAALLGTANSFTALQTITKTTEQLRLSYDASNYASFTVNSAGNLAINPAGTAGGPLGITSTITQAITDTGNSKFAFVVTHNDGNVLSGASDFSNSLYVANLSTSGKGGRQAIYGLTHITNPQAGGNHNFVGVRGDAELESADAAAGVFGMNPVAALSGVQAMNLSGMEVNVAARVGSTVGLKSGLQIAALADDAVQGSAYGAGGLKGDAAIVVSTMGNTTGWRNILLIADTNNTSGYQPVTSTSTLIATGGAATVTGGIDFGSYTFSSLAINAGLGSAAGSLGTIKGALVGKAGDSGAEEIHRHYFYWNASSQIEFWIDGTCVGKMSIGGATAAC